MPTTTPTQFDPSQLKASIVRLMQYRPRRLYLTHYSEVGQCARLANDMYDAIDVYVRIARTPGSTCGACASRCAPGRSPACAHTASSSTDDAIDAILDKDFELNAAGLAAWLKREGN